MSEQRERNTSSVSRPGDRAPFYFVSHSKRTENLFSKCPYSNYKMKTRMKNILNCGLKNPNHIARNPPTISRRQNRPIYRAPRCAKYTSVSKGYPLSRLRGGALCAFGGVSHFELMKSGLSLKIFEKALTCCVGNESYMVAIALSYSDLPMGRVNRSDRVAGYR